MSLWIEYELETLLSLMELLDTRLSELLGDRENSPDPDSFGYYDVAERLTGLAFVSCQTYLTTLCGSLGLEKGKALNLGPTHRTGMAKVQIVNHAANFWKHNPEWNFAKLDRRRETIEKAFDSIGFPVGTDYPLSGVLTELSAPEVGSLAAVAQVLRAWKADVLSNA
jgi:hypothetical protein